MKWVALVILWGSLAWGSALTISANTLWTDCVLNVSRHDPATLMPALYLQPNETRALVGALMKTNRGKWVLGLGDYLGSHEFIIHTAAATMDGIREVVYGGEILIRNDGPEAGLGEIYEVGVASGYLHRVLEGKESVAEGGIAFKNNPQVFLALGRLLMPRLFAEEPSVFTFDQKPHLLEFSPEDMRHTFTGFLLELTNLARKKLPLEATIEAYGRQITYSKLLAKIQWAIPHLKLQLSSKVSGYESLPTLLEQWRESELSPLAWTELVDQLVKLEADCKTVSDRILYITMD